MKIYSSYKVKIKGYNNILRPTLEVYRNAVDFLIDVCLNEWEDISKQTHSIKRNNLVEKLCHKTKDNPSPKYSFDAQFYKMPSYLRRAAIADAIGMVSSYKSNLANGVEASCPKAGKTFPCL